MKTYIKWGIMSVMFCLFVACKGQDKTQEATFHTYVVKAKPLHKILHFSGTVQPIQESSLVSPIDAVVQTMSFHYGQRVKKGDVVLTLLSSELQKQYNDALTDYLKAKDSYAIAQAKFVGTQELWHSGLLAKNNYLSEKSSVDTSRVSLMQASRKLTELLEKIDDNHHMPDVAKLNLSDFSKIKHILTASHSVIRLRAPSNGVMLYPPKSSDDKATRITVGASVKSGQAIALIGDLSGISIDIDVPEIDIGKIHPDMKAIITGVAFGKHQLNGRVVAVNEQASSTNNSGLPSFTAVVEVKALTPEEQTWLKVGMSAMIELSIDSEKQLLIPISAVKREKGQSVVQIKKADGRLEKRAVTTGTVQMNEVVIESGLHDGDVVVYD